MLRDNRCIRCAWLIVSSRPDSKREGVSVKRILVTSILALSLTACAVQPDRLTTASVTKFANDKLARVTADQEPVTHAITLHEAMARALKYNLDFHVELFNEALSSRQLAAARIDTLPELATSAYYNGRDNNSGNRDSVLFPDKEKHTEDIRLTWNILDFGLSYVRAKQAADEVLVAEERRRKIVNRVIEDVRTAYWRAVSADRLVAGLRTLEGRAEKALKNSRALEKEGQASPLTALTYQRELVEIQQRIQKLQKDLSLAKMQLAALMNIKPGEQFALAQPRRYAHSTELNMGAEDMIFAAMENRPEIRDIQYKLRINKQEAKRALLELLPGVNLFATANWDSDSYLLNSNWYGWGAKATWNVMQVFKYPAKKKVVQAKDEVLDARALAVTMAIITQVHVGRVRYAHSRKLYKTAERHLRVQEGIVKQIRVSHSEGQASEQTLIREEMNTLASRVSADIAYADLQNAYANVFASMGLDPYPGDFDNRQSLEAIKVGLEAMWIERGDTSGVTRAMAAARQGRHQMTTGSTSFQKPKTASSTNAWQGIHKESQTSGRSTKALAAFARRNDAASSVVESSR